MISPQDLEALDSRDLDARVAKVVFGLDPWVPKRFCHTGAEHHEDKVLASGIPYYSTSWEGFGAVIQKMLELGHDFRRYTDCVAFVTKEGSGREEIVSWGEDIRRPTCIAAIKAVEGNGGGHNG